MANFEPVVPISEDLKCGICQKMFENPRILSCLHSFCEVCLQKCASSDSTDQEKLYQHDQGTLRCASCDTITKLPAEGIVGLTADLRLTRVLDAMKEKEQIKQIATCSAPKKCDACGFTEVVRDNSPFSFCRDCRQVLCKRCTDAHAGIRATQGHTIERTADLNREEAVTPSKELSKVCPKHRDEKVKLFCMTCLEVLCHECKFYDHSDDKGHRVKLIQDCVMSFEKELMSRMTKVDKKSAELSTFIVSIEQVETEIGNHREKITGAINDVITEHADRVERKKRQLFSSQEKVLNEAANSIDQLRHQTQHVKSLSERSMAVSKKILDSKQDPLCMASVYRSLLEAMDQAIQTQPDEGKLNETRTAVAGLHYHAEIVEDIIGKVVTRCECTERYRMSISLARCSPKNIAFTSDGRVATIVQDVCVSDKGETVYVRGESETVYHQRKKPHPRRGEEVFYDLTTEYHYSPKQMWQTFPCPAIIQTSTTFPTCTRFSWKMWLPTLTYEDIRCFASLSDQRFIIGSSAGELYILGDTLSSISHELPSKPSIYDLATDDDDNIYVTDDETRSVFVLRHDGSLVRTVSLGDIAPGTIAVSEARAGNIVVTHEQTKVSVLDLQGKVLTTITCADWKKVAVACDGSRIIYVLWSDCDGEVTLERYSMDGQLLDSVLQKEKFGSFPAIAVSRAGTIALLTVVDGTGQVLMLSTK